MFFSTEKCLSWKSQTVYFRNVYPIVVLSLRYCSYWSWWTDVAHLWDTCRVQVRNVTKFWIASSWSQKMHVSAHCVSVKTEDTIRQLYCYFQLYRLWDLSYPDSLAVPDFDNDKETEPWSCSILCSRAAFSHVLQVMSGMFRLLLSTKLPFRLPLHFDVCYLFNWAVLYYVMLWWANSAWKYQ